MPTLGKQSLVGQFEQWWSSTSTSERMIRYVMHHAQYDGLHQYRLKLCKIKDMKDRRCCCKLITTDHRFEQNLICLMQLRSPSNLSAEPVECKVYIVGELFRLRQPRPNIEKHPGRQYCSWKTVSLQKKQNIKNRQSIMPTLSKQSIVDQFEQWWLST